MLLGLFRSFLLAAIVGGVNFAHTDLCIPFIFCCIYSVLYTLYKKMEILTATSVVLILIAKMEGNQEIEYRTVGIG